RITLASGIAALLTLAWAASTPTLGKTLEADWHAVCAGLLFAAFLPPLMSTEAVELYVGRCAGRPEGEEEGDAAKAKGGRYCVLTDRARTCPASASASASRLQLTALVVRTLRPYIIALLNRAHGNPDPAARRLALLPGPEPGPVVLGLSAALYALGDVQLRYVGGGRAWHGPVGRARFFPPAASVVAARQTATTCGGGGGGGRGGAMPWDHHSALPLERLYGFEYGPAAFFPVTWSAMLGFSHQLLQLVTNYDMHKAEAEAEAEAEAGRGRPAILGHERKKDRKDVAMAVRATTSAQGGKEDGSGAWIDPDGFPFERVPSSTPRYPLPTHRAALSVLQISTLLLLLPLLLLLLSPLGPTSLPPWMHPLSLQALLLGAGLWHEQRQAALAVLTMLLAAWGFVMVGLGAGAALVAAWVRGGADEVRALWEYEDRVWKGARGGGGGEEEEEEEEL
ncbi:hypothetical protein OC834_003122, partial [Tilletia horrida]